MPQFPYSGIRYSIEVDTASFMAYAREAEGHDSFGDGRPGNEYIAMDEKGKILDGMFIK